MAREIDATIEAADPFHPATVGSTSNAVSRTQRDFTPPDYEGDGAADVHANGIPDSCDCPADLDQDGRIGAEELFVVLLSWGMAGSAQIDADVTRDGTVDGNDPSAVLCAWGGCPTH